MGKRYKFEKRYKLTEKLTQWKSGHVGEDGKYDYSHYRSCHFEHNPPDGRDEYEIHFWEVPNKRVRDALITIGFNATGEFYRVRTISKTSFTKKELYEKTVKALEELEKEGYVEEIQG